MSAGPANRDADWSATGLIFRCGLAIERILEEFILAFFMGMHALNPEQRLVANSIGKIRRTRRKPDNVVEGFQQSLMFRQQGLDGAILRGTAVSYGIHVTVELLESKVLDEIGSRSLKPGFKLLQAIVGRLANRMGEFRKIMDELRMSPRQLASKRN